MRGEQRGKLAFHQGGIAKVEGKQVPQVVDAVKVGFVAGDADEVVAVVGDVPLHAYIGFAV